MHLGELNPVEQRVLGCLIEKRWTTPDQYPLSLNALRLACNQLTNRDPVTNYDEALVREAAYRLSRYGLARMASGHGSRATKYRHLAEEALSLERAELAILAVLLLRGPQTPGELKSRSERMASLASLEDVDRILDVLCERGYARRIPRRPGQKEDRFEHMLGGEPAEAASAPREAEPAPGAEAASVPGPEAPPTPGAEAAPTFGPEAAPTFGPEAAPTFGPEAAPTFGATPAPGPASTTQAAPSVTASAPAVEHDLVARVAELEAQVQELRRELASLRGQAVA